MRRRKKSARASGSEKAPLVENPDAEGSLRRISRRTRRNGAEDEDLETHYNLGIAFREMACWKRPSANFRKWRSYRRGKAFRYAMQCCTLLGWHSWKKGNRHRAIWYERALLDTRHGHGK